MALERVGNHVRASVGAVLVQHEQARLAVGEGNYDAAYVVFHQHLDRAKANSIRL